MHSIVIMMKLIDWILLLIIVALVLLALRVAHGRTRNGCCGSAGCSGNCGGCGSSCHCAKKNKKIEKRNKEESS